MSTLDDIRARLAVPVESYNFIQQAAAEYQLIRVDMPRLLAAVEAVLSLAADDEPAGQHYRDAITHALGGEG